MRILFHLAEGYLTKSWLSSRGGGGGVIIYRWERATTFSLPASTKSDMGQVNGE